MVSLSELAKAINMAMQDLAITPMGHLNLRLRRAIWRALGKKEKAEGEWARLGTGLIRRTRLASMCVRRVLAHWESVLPSNHAPHDLLDGIEFYVMGQMRAESLLGMANDLRDQVDALRSRSPLVEYLVGDAASAATSVALVDESFEEVDLAQNTQSETTLDPDAWDAAFYASIVNAGGAPWNAGSSIEKRREFWSWYLNSAISQAAMVSAITENKYEKR